MLAIAAFIILKLISLKIVGSIKANKWTGKIPGKKAVINDLRKRKKKSFRKVKDNVEQSPSSCTKLDVTQEDGIGKDQQTNLHFESAVVDSFKSHFRADDYDDSREAAKSLFSLLIKPFVVDKFFR